MSLEIPCTKSNTEKSDDLRESKNVSRVNELKRQYEKTENISNNNPSANLSQQQQPVQYIVQDILDKLQNRRVGSIYRKYQKALPSIKQQLTQKFLDVVDMPPSMPPPRNADGSSADNSAELDDNLLSLSISVEYLSLHVKTLPLYNPDDIESIDNYLREINTNLQSIKQDATVEKLEKLTQLLINFPYNPQKTDNTQCQNKVNKTINESIKLALSSCRYTLKKMHRALARKDQQSNEIELTVKINLKTYLNSLTKEVSELKQKKNATGKENENLILYAKSLENIIQENNPKEEIKNKIQNVLSNIENKKSFLNKNIPAGKKTSLLYTAKIKQLYLYLEYITTRISLIYDVEKFEKYQLDYLTAYTVPISLTNILIESIKELRSCLTSCLSNDEINNLINPLNNIAKFIYDPLFSTPAASSKDKSDLGGFLSLLYRLLSEQLYTQVLAIKHKPTKDKMLDIIENMTLAIGFAKEHLAYVSNSIDNEKKPENSHYSKDKYKRLQQILLSIFFSIIHEFPQYSFDKLKSKINNLYSTPKDEHEKKANYLQAIIYLVAVLKNLPISSLNFTTSELLTRERILLAQEKTALITSKPVASQNALIRQQDLKPLINSLSGFYIQHAIVKDKDFTGKNILSHVKNKLLIKQKIEVTHNEQIQATISSLKEDIQTLNRLKNYRNGLTSLNFCKPTDRNRAIKIIEEQRDKCLSNPKLSKSMPLIIQGIHLKLIFLQHQSKLDNTKLDSEYLPFVYRKEFIEEITQLKKLLIKSKDNLNDQNLLAIVTQLEKNVFGPLYNHASVEPFNLELTKIGLEKLKNTLDEVKKFTEQLSESEQKNVENLLNKLIQSITIAEIDIINLLQISPPTISPSVAKPVLKPNKVHTPMKTQSPLNPNFPTNKETKQALAPKMELSTFKPLNKNVLTTATPQLYAKPAIITNKLKPSVNSNIKKISSPLLQTKVNNAIEVNSELVKQNSNFQQANSGSNSTEKNLNNLIKELTVFNNKAKPAPPPKPNNIRTLTKPKLPLNSNFSTNQETKQALAPKMELSTFKPLNKNVKQTLYKNPAIITNKPKPNNSNYIDSTIVKKKSTIYNQCSTNFFKVPNPNEKTKSSPTLNLRGI